MVFATACDVSIGIFNYFRDLGMVEEVTTIFRRYDGNVRIWQLEFDECNSRFIAVIRRSLDTWAGQPEPLVSEVLGTDCSDLAEALAEPNPERPSLTWCVRRYLDYHPEHWNDYWSALGQCGVASQDFLNFLIAKGAVSREQVDSGHARIVTKHMSDPRYATKDFPAEVHEVVQVGRIVLDFTANQFPSFYHAKGYEHIPVPLAWLNRSGEDQVFAP